MAEGAGIDIVFKVEDGNLVAVVNGQTVALGKLSDALKGATSSTEALAEQEKNLAESQRTATESSGRLNRSLAGQLTAVSRLQGGVAGLLPGLASWTYLIRRLAIASRGILSLTPQWLIIAGAITAVGYAFNAVSEEADRAYERIKKVADLRASMEMGRRDREASQPLTELAVSREIEGKSSAQLAELLKKAQEDEKALADTMSLQVANATESRFELNRLRGIQNRQHLEELLKHGYKMSDVEDASVLGVSDIMGKWGSIPKLWDDLVKRLEEQVEEQGKSANATREELEKKRTYIETLKKQIEATKEAVRQQELENRLAKQAEEQARENQRVVDWAGALTDSSAKWVYSKDWEDRLRQMESTNDRASVEWQLYKLGRQQDAREETIRAYNGMSDTEKLAMSNDDLIKTLEEVKKAQEEYNRDAPFVSALERLAEKMDKLNETIEDKFSIFEKTWGGENEIESHGGRITDYDPYGGLSYSLSTADLERRQLEAQQSIQRSANSIATEGVPVRL